MKHLKKTALLFFAAVTCIYTVNGQARLQDLGVAKMGLSKTSVLKKLDLQQAGALPIEEAVQLPPSCFQFNTTCNVLPVQLLDFTAERANDETAALKWTTKFESGIRSYYTERSISPAAGFENRGFVAAGSPDVIKKEYRFNDPNDLTVISYYRLRIEHADGEITYSDVRPVKPVKSISALNVYPNPVSVTANVSITVAAKTAAVITWSDATGKKVKEQNSLLQAGTNKFTNDVSGLAGGSYFITVTTAEGLKLVTKFFKVRD